MLSLVFCRDFFTLDIPFPGLLFYVFSWAEELSETTCLPPKVEVMSAYTLPSPNPTRGITLDMLFLLLNRVDNLIRLIQHCFLINDTYVVIHHIVNCCHC